MTRGELHKFDPDWVVAPSESLREWLDHNGLSPRVASAVVPREQREHVTQLLQDVLDRKPITNEHELALAKVTTISAGFWHNFEHNYRAGLAAGKKDVSDG